MTEVNKPSFSPTPTFSRQQEKKPTTMPIKASFAPQMESELNLVERSLKVENAGTKGTAVFGKVFKK